MLGLAANNAQGARACRRQQRKTRVLPLTGAPVACMHVSAAARKFVDERRHQSVVVIVSVLDIKRVIAILMNVKIYSICVSAVSQYLRYTVALTRIFNACQDSDGTSH